MLVVGHGCPFSILTIIPGVTMGKNFNTTRQIRIKSAASILRALRAEPEMRNVLNNSADAIERAVMTDSLSGLVTAKRKLRTLREVLDKRGGLDATILSEALAGPIELLMPEGGLNQL